MPYRSRLEIVVDSRGAERNLRRVEGGLGRVDSAGERAEKSVRGMESSLGGLRTVALAASGALAAMGIGQLSRDTFDAIRSSQQLRASLKTVTGSAEAAGSAWESLLQFASETPFTLEQSVQGFIRMKSLGLDPTNEALRSFGNTASAMGKDMMQMVEAVADATTGEFERLKEFGIRASAEGDQVTFTFQGVETTVRNTSRAINKYLQSIGNEEFGGAMEEQMDTLGGKASNLQDSIYQLYLALGEAGATDAFNAALDGATETTEYLTNNIDSLVGATETLAILAGGRLVAAMGNAAGSIASKSAASLADAKAEATAAQAVTRRTGAELASAKAMLSSIRLEEQATRGTAAHAFALQELSVARVRATEAAGAHTAATNAATAAMSRASVAARGMAAASRAGAVAMTALGGPLGILIGGAGLLYVFRDELNLIGQRLGLTSDEVDAFRGELDDMSTMDMSRSLDSLNAELDQATLKAAAAREEIARLRQESSDPGPWRNSIVMGQDADQRREAFDAFAAAQQRLAETEQKRNMTRVDLWGRWADSVTSVTHATDTNTASVTRQAQAAEEAARQAEKFASSLMSLEDRLFPVQQAQREFRQDQILLQTALMDGQISIERYMDAWQRLEQAQRNSGSWQDTYDSIGQVNREMERGNDFAKEFGGTMSSALEDAIVNFESLGDVAKSFFEDLQRMLIRQSVTDPLAKSIGGFDWGSLASSIGSAFAGGGGYGGSGWASSATFANGGYTGDGGRLEPAGVVHRGEFVVQKSVVDNPGVRPMLERLNKGYADGGYVGPAQGGGSGGGIRDINITVPVTAQPGATERDGQRYGRGVGNEIKSIVRQVIANEMAPRGMLQNVKRS